MRCGNITYSRISGGSQVALGNYYLTKADVMNYFIIKILKDDVGAVRKVHVGHRLVKQLA